ncbi:hypothetical protein EKO27_g823 [Xylaria grammica]|uniref:Uncharacterized protein n=1 Tax=Xylaria grammica TaxID=363999 RepID=A0A439DIR1_9PEZI|nr:hypothetical protein F5X98DRAFT_380403 [Xylaria grammica]RWA14282.1 hypothetical protein EKO27_g823 [Xylaria grammica]GAW24547.1 hypothetical protein ANO14919_141340 [Xylariales sp. No.14919]
MPDLFHKIKDAVTGHHDDHAKDKKHSSSGSHSTANGARTDLDLNCARSSVRDPVDLTGRHVDPDDRDLDGSRRSHDHDAPDLTGPHRDHDNVDINGHHGSTQPPPDLNSPTASPTSRW